MLNLLACCAAQPDMFSGASMLHAPLTETASQWVSFVLRINPRRTRRRRGAHVCRGVCVCVHPAQSERASARQLCDACSCCAPPNSHEHANCGPSRFTSPELHATHPAGHNPRGARAPIYLSFRRHLRTGPPTSQGRRGRRASSKILRHEEYATDGGTVPYASCYPGCHGVHILHHVIFWRIRCIYFMTQYFGGFEPARAHMARRSAATRIPRGSEESTRVRHVVA